MSSQWTNPRLIQGGMGIGISTWHLARELSSRGQLGVISGTAIDTIIVRRLQDGDRDGAVRRALSKFPNQPMAGQFLDRYFVPGGIQPHESYALLPLWGSRFDRRRVDPLVLSAFVETYLAKEGHDGLVGMNLLTKIQFPTLPLLYGAMLAGVDAILMGAGIPRTIPGYLSKLASHCDVQFQLDLEGGETSEPFDFRPSQFGCTRVPLARPRFFAVISSHSLALLLAKPKGAAEAADGFVIEDYRAGGHNAPPRSKGSDGSPCYGERDRPDLEKVRALNLPFWLAGGRATPEKVKDAVQQGAAGVQVGTLFALCKESGMRDELKRTVRQRALDRTLRVTTDQRASPTGFPFKIAELPSTLSDDESYGKRERICDLGYLRVAYRRPDGKVGFRCRAEPVDDFVRKGGDPADAVGRRCLCNTLCATAAWAQRRSDGEELPLVTMGEELDDLREFITRHPGDYQAAEVVSYLLS